MRYSIQQSFRVKPNWILEFEKSLKSELMEKPISHIRKAEKTPLSVHFQISKEEEMSKPNRNGEEIERGMRESA